MTTKAMAINIDLYTSNPVPTFRVHAFVALIEDLIGSLLGEDASYLKHIVVLPAAEIDAYINTLIYTVDEHAVPYQSPAGFIGAKALPLEVKGELWCYIILPESELEHILPEGSEAQIVSSLLEELLHVRLYVAAFKQGVARSEVWWERDLSAFCRQFHDEYIVGRTKIPLLSSLFPPSDSDKDAVLAIHYPYPLAPTLSQGTERLVALMRRYDAGGMSLTDFWYQLIQVLYRNFFEPLARDAASRDGNVKPPPIAHNANEVRFYTEVIQPTWSAIYTELDASFQRNIEDLEACIARLVAHLVHFLASIGITF